MSDRPRLRGFDPIRDRQPVESLWRAALHPVWPVLPRAIDTFRAGYVAEAGAAAPPQAAQAAQAPRPRA